MQAIQVCGRSVYGQVRIAREHRRQQRAAIVNGPEALL